MKANITDLLLLHADLSKLNIDATEYKLQTHVLGNNEEFKRMWAIYEEARNKLININSDIFNKLRLLECPKPDKSNTYMPKGIYTSKHIIPLINEVETAIEYLIIYINSINADAKQDNLLILRNISKKFRNVSRQL